MQREVETGSRHTRPEPSMDRYRAPTAMQDHGDADDSDELGVFPAERYFYGDDAPWCESSWSSLSSSAFRTGTLENDRSVPTPTAATSSSEASWNSRSALLPNEPAEKLRAAAAAAASPIVEAAPSREESGRTDRRPGSSSNLRQWLLGVAGCACAGGVAAEESVSSDEMDTSNGVTGSTSGKKCNTGASELLANTEDQEAANAARESSGSGRWLLGGKEALSPIELVGHGHRRRATNPGVSSPILHPEATATSNERRRISSLEMFRPAVGDQGSALEASTQNSVVTVVPGNKALGRAPRATSDSRGSPAGDPRLACGSRRDSGEDDDAARSELGCAYPPSEASVVWSVVTADGAASGNFSSAASGYYYHYYFSSGEDRALRHAAAKGNQKRRSGMASGSSLLTCMSEKAVDAIGPARSIHRQEVEPAAVALATLGAAGGSRNGHSGRHHDVMRRR